MNKYKQMAMVGVIAAITWNMFAGDIAPAHAEPDVPQKQEEKVKSELETILETANKHLELGESQKAIDTCKTALQTPKYEAQPELNFFIGYVFSQHEGYETEADKAFTKAFDAVEDRFEKRMFAEDKYKQGFSADWMYPGARVCPSGITTIKKNNKDFLIFSPGEWNLYYNNDKNMSPKIKQVLKQDKAIDFDKFDKFMQKHGEEIISVSVHPEGYMVLGLGKYSLCINTTPGTEQKIYKLFI